MAANAKSGARRGRTRAAHLGPERRRPLVLDAAFRVFLERGYERASMEAIAAAAGVTKPVVYDCYPSKEELFAELLRREEERVLGEVTAALPRDLDLDDPEPTLARGFIAFLRAVARSPDAYRVIFLGEGGANVAVARRVRRGREQQVQTIASLARRWLRGRRAGRPPGRARARPPPPRRPGAGEPLKHAQRRRLCPRLESRPRPRRPARWSSWPSRFI